MMMMLLRECGEVKGERYKTWTVGKGTIPPSGTPQPDHLKGEDADLQQNLVLSINQNILCMKCRLTFCYYWWSADQDLQVPRWAVVPHERGLRVLIYGYLSNLSLILWRYLLLFACLSLVASSFFPLARYHHSKSFTLTAHQPSIASPFPFPCISYLVTTTCHAKSPYLLQPSLPSAAPTDSSSCRIGNHPRFWPILRKLRSQRLRNDLGTRVSLAAADFHCS